MPWLIEQDVRAFAPAVVPWLEREPTLNNVLYTVICSRAAGDVAVEQGSLWARLVDGDGAIQAVAIRTPPHPLLVSQLSPAAAESLAEALTEEDISGITGPTDAVGAFVAAWRRRGGHAELTMAQRMYQLDAVVPPAAVPGTLRAATEDDEELSIDWTMGFFRDTGLQPDHGAAEATRSRIARRRLWLWDVDGSPVSIACNLMEAAGVVRVGLVYTPTEHRRRGYASACVAALSQLLLDRGACACMLYTDLANPTSNAIYQTIGYKPVADAETWRLEA